MTTPAAEAIAKPTGLRGPRILCIIATAAFFALVYYANGGTRGTDQFWYVADTETLLNGDPPRTNMIFPGLMLRGEATTDSMYFMHNTLILHAVVPFAAVFGFHNGWLVFCTIAALITAAIVHHLIRRLSGVWPAAIGYSAFLLNPITIWSTANPLQEITWGLVSAVLVILMIRAGPTIKSWSLLSFAATVGILCNPIYMLVALGVPIVRLIEQVRWPRGSDLLYITLAFAAALLVNKYRWNWFPDSAHPTIHEIIISIDPDATNLEWHYKEDIPPVTGELMFAKVMSALGYQFANARLAVFFMIANLTLVGTILLAFTHRTNHRARRLVIASLALVGLTAVIAILHQNQFRYISIYLPATLCATVISVSHLVANRRLVNPAIRVLVLIFAGFIAVDIAAARHTRRDGIESAAAIKVLTNAIESYDADARVWQEVAVGESMLVAYAVRPRPCLSTRWDYQTDEELRELFVLFRPDIFICKPDSRLLDLFPTTDEEIDFPAPLTPYRLYRINADWETEAPAEPS